jgi:hypothetical protein
VIPKAIEGKRVDLILWKAIELHHDLVKREEGLVDGFDGPEIQRDASNWGEVAASR